MSARLFLINDILNIEINGKTEVFADYLKTVTPQDLYLLRVNKNRQGYDLALPEAHFERVDVRLDNVQKAQLSSAKAIKAERSRLWVYDHLTSIGIKNMNFSSMRTERHVVVMPNGRQEERGFYVPNAVIYLNDVSLTDGARTGTVVEPTLTELATKYFELGLDPAAIPNIPEAMQKGWLITKINAATTAAITAKATETTSSTASAEENPLGE